MKDNYENTVRQKGTSKEQSYDRDDYCEACWGSAAFKTRRETPIEVAEIRMLTFPLGLTIKATLDMSTPDGYYKYTGLDRRLYGQG